MQPPQSSPPSSSSSATYRQLSFSSSSSSSSSSSEITTGEEEAKKITEEEKEENTIIGTGEGPSFAEKLGFRDLCELFERLTDKGTKAQIKKKLVHVFFEHYKDRDLYPLLRLVLPQHDHDRQSYAMKETTIAKIYVHILGISERSEDGFRLLHWRRPVSDAEAGDFANAVYLSLLNRCQDRGTLSIAALNNALDQLCAAQDRNQKYVVLQKLLRHTTALEQKWIVRIILKDLKIGMNEHSILSALSENAYKLFIVQSDLKSVCEQLKTPNLKVFHRDGLVLFKPISPMLATRQRPESLSGVLAGGRYVIETKYDGERIQIHKDGDRIELFSRNCNNFTRLYEPHIGDLIRDKVKCASCILDGELLVYDTILQKFEEFGRIKNFVTQVRSFGLLDRNGSHIGKQLCYVAFDVLYVMGKSVMTLSLEQRTNILKRIIEQEPKRLEISVQRTARDIRDVSEAMDAAILNREEGIMVKNLDSTYLPHERKGHWIKLKPEYIDGVGDDLDLLIVGGYYSSGCRRGGTISHFLLGVAGPKDDTTPNGKQVFMSFTKVGSGYTDNELKILQGQLRDYWHNYDTRKPPGFLRLADGFKEKPDVWIEPQFSRVLQIKAAQVVPTDKFSSGVTLRFPRVTKLRTDKSWREATTLEEVLHLREQFQGHYGKRSLSGLIDDGKHPPKRPRRGGNDTLLDKETKRIGAGPRSYSVHPLYRDTDTSSVVQISTIFGGMEFCVMDGTKEHDKPELETLIVQHGGTKVQYPFTETTFCVLAATQTLKVRNIIESRRFDVVNIKWLLDCVSQERLLPLSPKYMMFATERTNEALLDQYDRFGDSYTEDATPQSLCEAFSQVGKQLRNEAAPRQEYKDHSETPASRSQSADQSMTSACSQDTNDPTENVFDSQEVDILGIERHYFKKKAWWSIFRGFVVYCDLYLVPGDLSTRMDCSSLDPCASLVKFYSGAISDTITADVTHVVMDKKDVSRLDEINRLVEEAHGQMMDLHQIHVVDVSWVYDSIRAGEDLVEDSYII